MRSYSNYAVMVSVKAMPLIVEFAVFVPRHLFHGGLSRNSHRIPSLSICHIATEAPRFSLVEYGQWADADLPHVATEPSPT